MNEVALRRNVFPNRTVSLYVFPWRINHYPFLLLSTSHRLHYSLKSDRTLHRILWSTFQFKSPFPISGFWNESIFRLHDTSSGHKTIHKFPFIKLLKESHFSLFYPYPLAVKMYCIVYIRIEMLPITYKMVWKLATIEIMCVVMIFLSLWHVKVYNCEQWIWNCFTWGIHSVYIVRLGESLLFITRSVF